MAKQPPERRKSEQAVLDHIAGRAEAPADSPAGRDKASPKRAAPSRAVPIGWMGYVGGVLWAAVFCAAGLAAWLVFAGGG